MNLNAKSAYSFIEELVVYLNHHLTQKPGLAQAAVFFCLEPAELQQLCFDGLGLSFEKLEKYINPKYYKLLLNKSKNVHLFSEACGTPLIKNNSQVDLSIELEVMTLEDTKNSSQGLDINYSFFCVPFGEILMASTRKGICYLAFFDDRELALNLLKQAFPKAKLRLHADDFQQIAFRVLLGRVGESQYIKLHLKATEFQLKVWRALLQIPFGCLSTYGAIAETINMPAAARAVGTAIGSNPIAIIIPCHRVIQRSGNLGGYMWGLNRKKIILAWEAAKINHLV
ncbi:MAG TPA: methylated-DNA--[protein]-cysteine S-methyltransferase [Pelobium sp.]